MAEFRGKIYDSIIDTIGATPLVRLPRFSKEHSIKADLVAKLEFFNPLSSVKDRIGKAMIDAGERDGTMIPGKTTIIEPTSGNTGIALAFVGASRGYKVILTMPESMSMERRKMLRLLGAELVLTPAEKGVNGAIEKAKELQAQIPGSVIPGQFENPANPAIHRETTALEIWNDTNGKADILISGVGTGGTITGVSQILKQKKPSFRTMAVEPASSALLSGGTHSPHKIQGIGPGFIAANVDRSIIDDVVIVENEDAFKTAREAAGLEGIPAGISSGAALWAAIQIGIREENAGKMMVVVLPSSADRYMSTLLFEGLE